MSRPSNRKPPRPDTQPLPGLNHTVLAGRDLTIDADSATPGAGNRLMILEVLSGGRRGLIKRCNRDKFRLGRRSHNDLSFDGKEDRAVSGNHLLFERRNDGWWAQDLKSTNGTLLNGKPLTAPALLTSEDILELGRRPEMGTGGTVKLRLRFEAAGEVEEEETQDEATQLRSGDNAEASTGGGSTSTSATATVMPPDDQVPVTMEQTAKKPTTRESAQPPAPQAQATPPPTGKLLADLQDKTLMLGKVSYHLEDMLAGLCRAALDNSKIEVEKLKGGKELLVGMETRAKLISDCKKAGADLAGHSSHAKALIQPLEAIAKSSEEELAKARQASEAASKAAASAAQALTKLDGDTRSTLKTLLSDVTKGLADGPSPVPTAKSSAPRPSEEAPGNDSAWTGWIEALEKSTAHLKERKLKLDEAAKAAGAARAALESAEATAKALTLKNAEAADALETKTAAMAERKSNLETELARLTELNEPAEDQEREAMAAFAEANLVGESEPLKALSGHAKAVSLAEQRKSLEVEVANLRKQLGA